MNGNLIVNNAGLEFEEPAGIIRIIARLFVLVSRKPANGFIGIPKRDEEKVRLVVLLPYENLNTPVSGSAAVIRNSRSVQVFQILVNIFSLCSSVPEACYHRSTLCLARWLLLSVSRPGLSVRAAPYLALA